MCEGLRIRDGLPPKEGSYVVYVNDDVAPSMPVASRAIMQWSEGRWWYPMSTQAYREHVYGWIGPLPVLRLED